MNTINRIVSSVLKKQISSIEDIINNAIDIQERTFKYLLENGKISFYGKMFHFDEIKNYDDFKRLVPINDYDSLKPFIKRNIAGEQQILWSSDIKWFSKSSGTTEDKSKFIPVSDEALKDCHYKVGAYTFASYLNNHPDSKITSGSMMSVTGSLSRISEKMMAGDVSAILVKNMDFWFKHFRSPSEDIALLSNWDEKLELIAQKYSNKNVVGLVGVPSWGLMILKKVLEANDKEKINHIWHNFELFVHGGVSFEPYRCEFSRVLGDKVNYIETYNASEGYFAFQEETGVDMLLATDSGIFYEFISMSEINEENPKTICLAEVELNKNYALVISTNAGLWRYKIGDTVKFTSLKPYRIRITGRTKAFINAFGEELIVDNAIQALKKTCEQTKSDIKEFTAAPVYLGEGQQARHQWFIEFNEKPKTLDNFAKLLDDNLKSLNSDYESKRKGDMILHRLEIIDLPAGTFEEWFRRRGKFGGQSKVQRLCNDRLIADSLLGLMAERNAN